ncbi:DUF4229 domain-containing protein [Ktedonobacteria bacterium brp13]|nr:DUF4229 domain-containing protein [Ktedonobacteria bacterium brp13]
MKRAVATALVLIAGAAVVLWYGNTLNSWVLGGLIGGLAALLISIPISLTLFSYLSHRQEERLFAEREELAAREAERALREERLLRLYEREDSHSVSIYQEAPEYIDDIYPPAEDDDWIDTQQRYLPAPQPMRQLPASSASRRSQQSMQRPPHSPQAPTTRKLTRELETPRRQGAVTRRLGYPGFPGYQANDTRSRFQSQALRLAREEAARQDDGYKEEEPLTNGSQRSTYEPTSSLRYSGQDSAFHMRSGRRIIDSSLSPISPHGEEMKSTENSGHKVRYSETEVLNTQPFTGDLQKPLVRRAPYMYDDDELKSELAQQAHPPITRRSSRKLIAPQEDD